MQFESWFFQAVLRMVGMALGPLFGNIAGTNPQKAALLPHRQTTRIDRKTPQSGVSSKVCVLKDHLPLLGETKPT